MYDTKIVHLFTLSILILLKLFNIMHSFMLLGVNIFLWWLSAQLTVHNVIPNLLC